MTAAREAAVGYGSDCLKKATGGASRGPAALQAPRVPPTLSRAATANPVPACAGQTELPLADHQPTLWSL